MGKYALDSEMEWVSVPLWKKRECYIAFCRWFKKMEPYRKYQFFKWSDYLSRSRMAKTFMKRHLPFTNGSIKLVNLVDPSSWSTSAVSRRKGMRKRKTKKTTCENVPQKAAVASASASTPTKQWDSDTESWIEYEK